jgi:serine/threonine protein kinase
MHDFDSINLALHVPKSKSYETHLAERIRSALASRVYNPKVIELVLKALHPDPEKRANIKQLRALMEDRTSVKTIFKPKIEEDYFIVNEITHTSMTSLQELRKTYTQVVFPVIGETIPNVDEVASYYLVEHKETMKRYNALRITFRREKHAAQYCDNSWKQRINFDHENLVPIHNHFLQMDSRERFQLYIVKERYYDVFTEFIAAKRSNKEYLDEKKVVDYASQILSALSYLHTRKYISAPGDINSNCVFFTQMYDTLLLDVGRIASSISTEELLRNSAQLLKNPFVSPECKAFLESNSDVRTYVGNDYIHTEKGDIYSFGVLLFMLISLYYEPISLCDTLDATNVSEYGLHLAEQLEIAISPREVRGSLFKLLLAALEPNPEKRASVKQLVIMISEVYADIMGAR